MKLELEVVIELNLLLEYAVPVLKTSMEIG